MLETVGMQRNPGRQSLRRLTHFLKEPTERRMYSNCLLATIYHRFGIDTSQPLYTSAERPIPILSSGEPIAELL